MIFKKFILIVLLSGLSATANSSENNGVENRQQCGFLNNFVAYKDWLSGFPTFTQIKQNVDWDGFLEVAQDTSPEKGFLAKMASDDESLILRTESIIWRTVWVDQRIRRIVKWREVCTIEDGELLLEIDDGSGRHKTDIVLYKKIGGKWLRGAPYISNISSALGIPILKALEQESYPGYDFDTAKAL